MHIFHTKTKFLCGIYATIRLSGVLQTTLTSQTCIIIVNIIKQETESFIQKKLIQILKNAVYPRHPRAPPRSVRLPDLEILKVN